jgi:hypothetical protein
MFQSSTQKQPRPLAAEEKETRVKYNFQIVQSE